MQELINAGFALALGYAGLVLALVALSDIRPVHALLDALEARLVGWAFLAAAAIGMIGLPLAPLLTDWPGWSAYAYAFAVGAAGAALIAASFLRELSREAEQATFGLGVIYVVIAVVAAAATWLLGWAAAFFGG